MIRGSDEVGDAPRRRGRSRRGIGQRRAQSLVDGQLELLLPVSRLEDDVTGLGVSIDEVQRSHGQTICAAPGNRREHTPSLR